MYRRNYGQFRSTSTSKYRSRDYLKGQHAARAAAAHAARRVPAVLTTTVPRYRNIRTGGFLGIEKKFLDVYASTVTIGAATDCSGGEMQPEGGCTGCLTAPAQGDGESNRDGRRIELKSIYVQGCVEGAANEPDQADSLAAPVIFIALVLDKQANGATIVSEQVFTNPNDTALVNCYPLRNLQYSSRYRVLASTTFSMGPINIGTDGANTTCQQVSPKPFKLAWSGSMPVTFTSTTADVANVADNAVHVIAFATATKFTPAINYNARTRFVG